MRKSIKLLLLAACGVVLASCNMINNSPSYQLSDLQGLWQENNSDDFVRFTTEQSDEAGYLLGYEWDASDQDEATLLAEREALGRPGNGWFKYMFESKGDLHEIHLMNNKGGEIPKEYIVSKLTDTELVYYEKNDKKDISYFTKVVEPKK